MEEVELDEPRDDEILVRLNGVGICGGDLAAVEQIVPSPLPAVLGHEAAGIVERVGSRVSTVAAGDAVALSFNSCGHCAHCADGRPAYCDQSFPLNWGAQRPDGSATITDRDGTALGSNFFGQSSFAEYALANERNTIKVPAGTPLELLGPLGCGFMTVVALGAGVGDPGLHEGVDLGPPGVDRCGEGE